MFMEYETWVDKLCAAFLLVGGITMMVWWFGFVLPDRDAKLWKVNACYVERGCEQIDGTPTDNELARQCWAECTVQARENGLATNRGR